MELVGEQMLKPPRARVWQALNDPAVLKRCVPGCDLFEREDENRFKVGMTAVVGPVKARFNGRLMLSDIEAPTSYSLSFEGTGGAAGFGKGNARVTLADAEGGATRLSYTVNAQVGGKLAQVGARLIDGVAGRMADEFFTRFARALTSDETMGSSPAASQTPMPESVPGSAQAPPPQIAAPARSSGPSPEPAAPSGHVAPVTLVTRPSSSIVAVCTAIAVVAAAVAVLAAAVAVYVVR
jgi:carbon monoxide dehydrogenase subunit G